MIIEELLPALEELTQTPKCTWCLYPSPSCACGSVQARAQCRARDLPEDPPPPYQRVVLTAPQSTTRTLSSHAQAPGHVYPTPILGSPEEPPPVWLPTAAEQGLRPTIEPHSQSTATTTQRAVSRLPPPPGLMLPTTVISALMSLTLTSGPTSSVTPTSTTRTRNTTASTGPSVSSSSQRESRGHGQVRLQGPIQVGSSQAGAQQSSQRQRHAQSQGCSQSRMSPLPQSQSQRRTQTTTTSEGDRQARASADPSSSSSVAQQASTQGDACQETPMDTSEVRPRDEATLTEKWGDPHSFDDEGPDMPKSEGWKAD